MTAAAPLPPSAAPHAHDRARVDNIMLQVCGALLPCTLYGIYLFGWPALILFTITCLSAVATEALCLHLQGRSPWRVLDGSALLTGWLIALTLPPWAPWWIGVGGAAFAIAVGKQLYGGLGQNVFNPAMLTRVAILISFPVQLTTWVNVTPFGSAAAPGFIESLAIIFAGQPPADGMTGATLLGEIKTYYTSAAPVGTLLDSQFSAWDAALGQTRGSLGETSELLVLLGGLWLLWRKIISWHIPLAMLGSVLLLAALFHSIDADRYAPPLFHLTSGALVLGAFFIATDYVTSPSAPGAKLIFGAGCGLVLFAIRSWGGFPEAVGFAVLFMNALTPLLDRWCRPRVYGRNLRGQPLKPAASARKVQS
jgi:electron transport complex protein RnfD